MLTSYGYELADALALSLALPLIVGDGERLALPLTDSLALPLALPLMVGDSLALPLTDSLAEGD
jgi:hypothetical protein